MQEITQENLDQVRKSGLRPVVVVCFVGSKKLFMVYKAEHKLWQLPQGGIENGETISQALHREMKEELGRDIVVKDKDLFFLGEDSLTFSAKIQGNRELKTDDGGDVEMKGKKYYFVAAKNKLKDLDIRATEFDGFDWLNYESAVQLTQKIYQAAKREMYLKVIQLLKENKLIK